MQGCVASKMSNNTRLKSLCQHPGQALTGWRVRATEQTAARSSCKNGDGTDGSLSVLKHVHLIFLHTEVTCENTLRKRSCTYVGEDELFFYTFF